MMVVCRTVVLDVRVPTQFGMCHLSGSINIPYSQLEHRLDEVDAAIARAATDADPTSPVTGVFSLLT